MDALRTLPPVHACLGRSALQDLAATHGPGVVRFALRAELAHWRDGLKQHDWVQIPDLTVLDRMVAGRVLRLCTTEGRRAINATGILLHTGLGRAPLSEAATAALAGAGRYGLLQADLAEGKRSLREERVQELLQALTGAEAVTLANNNAAATMLILSSLAAGREVVVSRGQLVEIGGSFRIPEVMARSGCTLVEVGTTNRTHLADYERAITPATAALLHVHTSNYRIRGFTGWPNAAELCPLAAAHRLPVIDDLGSGALVPLREFGLDDEPLVADTLRAGTAVACCSGDKLIGGPQCGIILGQADRIAAIRKHPLARMFRVGRLILAALERTLVHFLDGSWRTELPFYRMLAIPAEVLQQRVRTWAEAIPPALAGCAIRPDHAYVGSGSLPDQGLATWVLAVQPRQTSVAQLARRLREGLPAVFARVHDGCVLLDPRTVFPDEDALITAALPAALA